jgi:hypothetical protein
MSEQNYVTFSPLPFSLFSEDFFEEYDNKTNNSDKIFRPNSFNIIDNTEGSIIDFKDDNTNFENDIMNFGDDNTDFEDVTNFEDNIYRF